MSKDVQPDAATCNFDSVHFADSACSAKLRILRLHDVVDRVGLSRSSVYNRIRAGEFPRAIGLGGRAVGFVEQEIDGWLSAAAERRIRSPKSTTGA